MVKQIVTFKVREGVDPEEVWKFWEEVHAPPHMVPGLVKYCINRVVQVLDGEPTFWGIAELWFEDEEAVRAMDNSTKLHQAIKDASRLPGGGWFERITDHVVIAVEEKTIVEGGTLVKK